MSLTGAPCNCSKGQACSPHTQVGGLDNYTCTCLPGYQGRTCQVNTISSYLISATVTPNTWSYNIQVDIDDCEGNPCINGGTCEVG